MEFKPTHTLTVTIARLDEPGGASVAIGPELETKIGDDGRWRVRADGFEADGETLNEAIVEWLRLRIVAD